MSRLSSRADLVKEVEQLREDLSLLCKVVVNNRRIIALLEYSRAPTGWTYVPVQAGSVKGEALNSASTSAKSQPSSRFQAYPYSTLAAHVLRSGGQL